MTEIRINSYIPLTTAEGPKTRFAIWVQGCSIRCKGCANKEMWDKNGGTLYKTEDFIEIIKSYKDKIEGITFLGGEPLEQIEGVIEISKAVKSIGLDVLVFTGNSYNKIKENKDFKELLKYIDILIDGEFTEEKTDYSRPWAGSSNQNYYFITDKYNESIFQEYKNKLEIRITPENKIMITGMGDYKKIKEQLSR